MKKLTLLFYVFIVAYQTSSAQNVGVGNTNPQSVLDVQGDFALRSEGLVLANGSNNDVNIVTAKSANYQISGPTADFELTGLTGGVDGRMVTLFNATLYQLTVKNNVASATANQIMTPGSNDVVIPAKGAVTLQYNLAAAKWVVTGTAGSGPQSIPDLRMVGDHNHITQDAGVGSNGTTGGTHREIAIGHGAGDANAIGSDDIIIGTDAGKNFNNDEYPVVIIGNHAYSNATAGLGVVVIGNYAANHLNADNAVAIGHNAGGNANTGQAAVAIGADALGYGSNMNNCVAVGSSALSNNAGDNNTAIGTGAGVGNTSGSNNTLLGAATDVTDANLTNATAVGYQAKVSTSNSIILGDTVTSVNVGIGTAAPSSRLHIKAPTDPLKIQGLQSGNNADSIMTIDANGIVHLRNANVLGGGWALQGNSGTDTTVNFIGTTDNEPFSVRTNNKEHFSIDKDGNFRMYNDSMELIHTVDLLSGGIEYGGFKRDLSGGDGILINGIMKNPDPGIDWTTIEGYVNLPTSHINLTMHNPQGMQLLSTDFANNIGSNISLDLNNLYMQVNNANQNTNVSESATQWHLSVNDNNTNQNLNTTSSASEHNVYLNDNANNKNSNVVHRVDQWSLNINDNLNSINVGHVFNGNSANLTINDNLNSRTSGNIQLSNQWAVNVNDNGQSTASNITFNPDNMNVQVSNNAQNKNTGVYQLTDQWNLYLNDNVSQQNANIETRVNRVSYNVSDNAKNTYSENTATDWKKEVNNNNGNVATTSLHASDHSLAFNINDNNTTYHNLEYGTHTGAFTITSSDNTGKIGVNEADPQSTLEVKGSIATSAITYTGANTNVNLDNSQYIIVVQTGGTSVNLPPSNTCNGRQYIIKNTNISGTTNIIASGADTIDGASSVTLAGAWSKMTLVNDGNGGWLIIQ